MTQDRALRCKTADTSISRHMRSDLDYQTTLESILEEVRPLARQGQVADYIPELNRICSGKLGIALCMLDGREYFAGEAQERFSIQSISKLFTLIMAYRLLGDKLWERVGREPSGNPFNSLIQLESDRGMPRNPFINAGALVVTDILCSHYVQTDRAILGFIRQITGVDDINFNSSVSASEAAHGFRNAAVANFLKSFGRLEAPVETVLQTYFRHCAIEMSCLELAKAALLIANKGVVPGTADALMTADEAKRINAILLTCGAYNAAGDFAFRIGLPAKSGIGGGILAILPEKMAICVWSPPLDRNGNSLAGATALEKFSASTGHSIF